MRNVRVVADQAEQLKERTMKFAADESLGWLEFIERIESAPRVSMSEQSLHKRAWLGSSSHYPIIPYPLYPITPLPHFRIQLLAHHVLGILVVLLADVFNELRVSLEYRGLDNGPRSRIRLRVVYRDGDVHVAEVFAAVPLGHA